MRTRKRAILIAVITLVALLPSVAAVQAEAIMTTFTGTETCHPTDDWGTWSFPDGNIHIRGMVLQCTEVSSDPRATGANTVVLNANLSAYPGAPMGGIGPIWGTWQLITDEGGYWAGTWEGLMTPDGSIYHTQGTGAGMYEGMKQWIDSDHGSFEGRVLDPHGGE